MSSLAGEYFETIDKALIEQNFTKAQTYMAKLSSIYPFLSKEDAEYYHYLEECLEFNTSMFEVLEEPE